MLELPTSLHKIDTEGSLEADFNPLISPPAYILAEGLRTVQMYLRIREIRREEMEELLEDEDFEVNMEAAFPTSAQVRAVSSLPPFYGKGPLFIASIRYCHYTP